MRTGKHLKNLCPYWGYSILSALSSQQSTKVFLVLIYLIYGLGGSDRCKSAESALKGKHFRPPVPGLQLVYEALQRRFIQTVVFKGIHLLEKLKQQLATIRNLSLSSQEQISCAVKFAKLARVKGIQWKSIGLGLWRWYKSS